MEQVNENANKNLPNHKTRKSLAITSFVLGFLPLIFLILKKLKSPLSNSELFSLVAIFSPIFAVIYGIIALTEKENKFFSLAGIVLGILTFFFISNGAISDSTHDGYAKEAKIRADLSQTRSIAEMIWDEEDSYSTLCDKSNTLNDSHPIFSSELKTIEDDIVLQLQKSGKEGIKPVCFASADSYCVSTMLTGEDYYCYDATGFGSNVSKSCNSANKCPIQ
jgi:hypothetical protein